MRKKVWGFMAIVIMLAFALGFAAPSKVLAKPVTFKAVAFLPVNNVIIKGFKIFAEKINQRFGDSIKIELIGGPEVTPPFQLHEAVRNGVIDMCLTSCGYYPSLLWEAQTAMFTNKNYKEIAQTDYFNIMSKLHKKVGLVWLGAGTFNMVFHLYTNPKINTPKDFAGKKIRVFPPFIPFIKALGAVPINLPMGDIYTAMERGAVDGFVQVHNGFVKDFHWNEVTKYVIDYPLYQATAIVLANPKKWAQVPAGVRKQIIDFKSRVIDPAIYDYYEKENDKDWQLMINSGVKPIKFSEADGKAFLKLAYDSAWDRVISKSPKLGPKLKKMLVK
ncbi:MAG: TRAP transporter substrate-binding protein DctP [Deltaproteobacteria bacterium]|nr:TRAP transporter substrate-binding protein DctP [Deltaproteobacteria bacterium]MBW2046299.1 TRAP transporter substrate-binding protein DctP [Deltaproteobacteria bacterium]MBW2299493.1 TRAP transporter substrate-binding protein DctP [Deltaproteobacteria bacterium]